MFPKNPSQQNSLFYEKKNYIYKQESPCGKEIFVHLFNSIFLHQNQKQKQSQRKRKFRKMFPSLSHKQFGQFKLASQHLGMTK